VSSSHNYSSTPPDQTETLISQKAISESLGLGLDLDPREMIKIINILNTILVHEIKMTK
ncbi:31572_t:CDS:1, partial [Racocetra persica]